MSEKVTFQELIDAISEETNNSKKFTHDFLKDLVTVINSGLEEDGNVNIAGFGKFKLREMDEREGYNPQTGEKITIPAHNKVVFKPYKDLRELVNAPYSGLEPEIIEERQESPGDAESDTTPTAATESEEKADSAPWETDEREEVTEDTEEVIEDTGQAEQEGLDTEPGEEDEDVVEFRDEEKKESPLDDYLNKARDQEKEEETAENQEQEPIDEDIAYEPEASAGEADEARQDETAASKTDEGPSLSEEQDEEQPGEPEAAPVAAREATADSGGVSKWTYIAGAAVVLLLIVSAIWLLRPAEQQGDSAVVTKENQTEQADQANQSEAVSETGTVADSEPQSQAESRKVVSEEETATSQPAARKSIQFTIKEGMTLWGLAKREYQDPYLWPWIYDANQSSIKDPDLILTGQQLSIPVPDEADGGLSETDSLEVAKGYVVTYHFYNDKGREKAKFYLWAAKTYDKNVFDHIDRPIDEEDLAFANRVR